MDSIRLPLEVRQATIGVPGILAFSRRKLGIERINVFKMRSRSVEALAINPQMAVLTDLHAFPAQGHQSFDIKLVWRNVPIGRVSPLLRDAFRVEADYFTALGRP